LPLERAVLDLHLLVDATRQLRPRALARDHEHALADHDAHALRRYARQFDDHRQGVRIVGVEAVEVRAEAAAEPREPRHLPEVREELLDLLLQLVDVPSAHLR